MKKWKSCNEWIMQDNGEWAETGVVLHEHPQTKPDATGTRSLTNCDIQRNGEWIRVWVDVQDLPADRKSVPPGTRGHSDNWE